MLLGLPSCCSRSLEMGAPRVSFRRAVPRVRKEGARIARAPLVKSQERGLLFLLSHKLDSFYVRNIGHGRRDLGSARARSDDSADNERDEYKKPTRRRNVARKSSTRLVHAVGTASASSSEPSQAHLGRFPPRRSWTMKSQWQRPRSLLSALAYDLFLQPRQDEQDSSR